MDGTDCGDPSHFTAVNPPATPLPDRSTGPEALRHCLTTVLPINTVTHVLNIVLTRNVSQMIGRNADAVNEQTTNGAR